jgi:hypothetical protein
MFMRSRTGIAIALAVYLLLAGVDCVAQNDHHDVKKQLSQQGFSGLLKGKVHINELGSLQCGMQSYRVFFWEWEESNTHGNAVHAANRVIFFDRDRFIGCYSVEDRPIMPIKESVLFSYPEEWGNRIACTDIGPGKRIVLNGEWTSFFK